MSDPAVLLDTELGLIAFSGAYPSLVGLRRRQLMNTLDAGLSTFELVGGDPKDSMRTARVCMETNKAMHFAEEVVTNHEGLQLTVILS